MKPEFDYAYTDIRGQEANMRLANPFTERQAKRTRVEQLVADYQQLTDQLRESRITSDNTDDDAVKLYERMIQARIEKQLILLDTVVIR